MAFNQIPNVGHFFYNADRRGNLAFNFQMPLFSLPLHVVHQMRAGQRLRVGNFVVIKLDSGHLQVIPPFSPPRAPRNSNPTPTPNEPPPQEIIKNRSETDPELKSEMTTLKNFVQEENKFLKNELKRMKEQRMEMKKSISDLTNLVMSQNETVATRNTKDHVETEVLEENAELDDEVKVLKESLEQEIHSLIVEKTSKVHTVSEESEQMKKEWEKLKETIEQKLSSVKEQTDLQSDSLVEHTSEKIHPELIYLQIMKHGLNEVIENFKQCNEELQMEVSQLKLGH